MLRLARNVLDRSAMIASSNIDLLLVHADDHTPVLEDGVAGRAAADGIGATPLPAPDRLWSESADGNDLERQRWGVVVPAGEDGDRLLDAVAPLRACREAQQGGRPARVYRVPSCMDLAEAHAWKQRCLRPDRDLDVDVPRYVLILGDLDQVSASVQTILALEGFVGRLAFDRLDEYRAYADKVLRWEAREVEEAAARHGDAVLHTVHDGTAAALSGHRALMAPGLEILRARRQLGDVRAHDLRAAGSVPPDPEDVWRAASADRPCVLFSHAHGEGAPRPGWRSAALQRRYQGAMSFGRGLRLTGRDMAGRAFLPGGVWLLLSCFSAGTPVISGYRPWLEELHRLGHVGRELSHVFDSLALERPFVSALPKAVLSSPEGPLAFIGHVDLAWSYSFMDLASDTPRERPGRFMNVLQSLLAGDRAGVAFRNLFRTMGEVQTELSALMERAGRGRIRSWRERAQRAHLWMQRQDLAGYVLLGDPAVRLPGTGTKTGTGADVDPADAARVRDPVAVVRGAVRGAGGVGGEGALPLPMDELEQAVGKVLSGQFRLRRVAREHGVDEALLQRLVERYRAGGRRALDEARQEQSETGTRATRGSQAFSERGRCTE